nr:GNAT family N-acetyltransferase [uncultured Chryseobacterium sp.]
MTIKRLDSTHPHFQSLVKHLDATLAEHNGDDNDFFTQFNTIDTLKQCIVIYVDEVPAACGAFKVFSENTVEIKRMYTDPQFRKRGLASALVTELENWAKEMGFQKAILETSKELTSAISVYEKSGFYKIPNYGQYIEVDTSVCYEKEL